MCSEISAPSVTLSKTERAILRFCERRLEDAGASRVTLAEVIEHFHPDGAPTAHVPSAFARRLRLLQLKTTALGIPGPVRVSPVGRGNRAVYQWREVI